MKLKNMKELDVIVLEKLPVKNQPNVWRYECGVLLPKSEVNKWSPDYVVEMDGKYYLWIGTTYNCPIKAKKGDILEVRMIRIRRYIDEDTGLPHLTWMFPVVIRKRTDKKEPDPLSQALKIEKAGVHPLHELSADTIIRINLPDCPYWTDPNICPLRTKFRLSTIVIEEYLRFPIKCALAKYFKCRFVKPYYYTIRIRDIKEVDDLVA